MPIYKGSEKIKNIAITGQNTNCLTHIPQDIKLTLSNGTLILKAGSKVYVPNGKNADGSLKFDVVVVESDISYTASVTDSNKRFVYYNKDNRVLAFITHSSGATAPTTGAANQMFYNTSDNTIKRYNNGALTDENWSLPLGIITANGSVTTGSITQIFNGLGYIGSTVFALPNIKGLIPDGRNADGTLKSIEFTTQGVLTATRNISGSGSLVLSNELFSNYHYCIYHDGENLNKSSADAVYYLANAGTWSADSNGKITAFTPKAVQSPLKPHYIDKVYKGSTLVYQGAYKANQVVFEKATAGTYSVNLEKAGLYEITVVGGGGAAAMRGQYDDKGYGWTGGSGGAFVGTFVLERGTRTVVVGKANNNTTAQSGNTQTLNPTDTRTYPSSVSGVVSVGGGGSGHYSSNYVGAAGAAANLTMTPTSTTLNKAGNAGVSGSGGKGGGAGATINGGASVYNGYGKGQGCVVSEYAAKRSWINGTGGYVKIVYKGRRP